MPTNANELARYSLVAEYRLGKFMSVADALSQSLGENGHQMEVSLEAEVEGFVCGLENGGLRNKCSSSIQEQMAVAVTVSHDALQPLHRQLPSNMRQVSSNVEG
ncbi:hypothetical protein SK128_024828 [Halocaridina rubra]|uniref:Uncharacterized protein n=1 Tax=Halocaridina rubra TaxID=373956 RepID=A0AAN8X192_HALRR